MILFRFFYFLICLVIFALIIFFTTYQYLLNKIETEFISKANTNFKRNAKRISVLDNGKGYDFQDEKLSTNELTTKHFNFTVEKLQKELFELRLRIEKFEQFSSVANSTLPKLKNISSISFINSNKHYGKTKNLPYFAKKKILITGGAGFVGSHLVDRLLLDGHEVIVVDNFFTGRRSNVEHWIGHSNFELLHHDVVNPLYVEVDEIYHLASPASPPHYMFNAVKTIKTNTIGTINMLGLAKRVGARILVASTSEVYGDPDVHPQSENYWGNVNPIGPRSCYDESKRTAETLTYAYARQENLDVRVARIFNTYGPRMYFNDGRVISNFIIQALQKKPLTVYGLGNQTRSFQYVSDLVEGLVRLMASNYSLPVNLGNPEEYTINQLAKIILNLVGNKNNKRKMIVHLDRKEDDPQRRRPDITIAHNELNWQPNIKLIEGLKNTIEHFRSELEHSMGEHH